MIINYDSECLAGEFIKIDQLILLFSDNETPVIDNMPGNITKSTDTGLATATVTWTQPTAHDNSGVQTLTSSYSSGDSFEIGKTIVTYISVDGSGNMITNMFSISVEGRPYGVHI